MALAVFVLSLTLWVAPADSAGLTARQYRQLRAEAKTTAEFRQLAVYADQHAAENRKKAAECQEELDKYLSGTNPPPAVPKHPTRVETLKSLIAHHRIAAERWAGLSREYLKRAEAAVNSSDPGSPS
jgi:hypothetical protein